jgi:hypothetical protein
MEQPLCAYCHEIMGVYESVRVMLADGTELRGSPLTLGEELEAPGSVAVHARCYDVFQRGRSRGRAGAAD